MAILFIFPRLIRVCFLEKNLSLIDCVLCGNSVPIFLSTIHSNWIIDPLLSHYIYSMFQYEQQKHTQTHAFDISNDLMKSYRTLATTLYSDDKLQISSVHMCPMWVQKPLVSRNSVFYVVKRVTPFFFSHSLRNIHTHTAIYILEFLKTGPIKEFPTNPVIWAFATFARHNVNHVWREKTKWKERKKEMPIKLVRILAEVFKNQFLFEWEKKKRKESV